MDSNFKTSASLKSSAKEILHGNWSKGIILNIIPTLYYIFVGIGTVAYTSTYNYYDPQSATNSTNSAFGIIVSILLGILTSGIVFVFIDWLNTKNAPETPFKSAFVAFTKDYFAGSFFIQLLNYIWVLLWSILLIVPGVIKAIAYSQAMFIYKDAVESGNTSDHYRDYITKSRQMMDGNKWRYFVLQLSFLGWDILAWLTLGIGYIWLAPYKSATFAAFYLDLKENQNTAEIID
ncbi:DUF975 family protein [Companilactobacillus metriopterae]|uniref:DUF975 family protein n=1 Tax=Companilactobacillus metriopterae TaxID=1909267 RepID=UPI00100AB429|nr:DUF975 family protein [Companilactobacillus metriopterae]